MKLAAKGLLPVIAGVGMIAALPPLVAAETCTPTLPPGAAEVLASAYPDYRVLRLADLNADDQGIWKNAYHNACPGVVEGYFTGKKGYAVLLIPTKSNDGETRAVLLSPKEGGGLTQKQIFTEHRVGNLPVIRRSDPGTYEDPGKRVKVTVPNDVVLVEHLESKVTAIVFVKGERRLLTIAD
jgi:hypothetical protein